ncbi:hypothetical protein [Pseudoalteromonas tunicata]|jgi:hypothetical protein|uniref:Amino acid transport protein n=1 Tax=Pseudoalteromonas tunicata D2 TaxID=87626 RepID=A4C444_9GAMM|nr:hypothetical protein [Pseudoalteromonas tunicata]AXT33291.1 hypothetical protein D1819_21040 [Pseudoalteromonas tunicata]EAR30326.1 hypothetical protein PTD2_02116 [Pseudoalteromonas tunicata D2]
MDTTAQLLWGILFGGIGLGYFIYGKKQRAVVPLLAGIGLLIVPYFIVNIFILVITGVALIILPYFIKI